MKRFTKRSGATLAGLALGASVVVFGAANPGFAASNDGAIAQALVTSTLGGLGLTDLSPDLTASLSSGVQSALAAGVIDPTIRQAVAGVLENPDMLQGLSDVFAKHLKTQVEDWKATPVPGASVTPFTPGRGGEDEGDNPSPRNTTNGNSGSRTNQSNQGNESNNGNGENSGNGNSGGSSGGESGSSGESNGGGQNPGNGSSPGNRPTDRPNPGKGQGGDELEDDSVFDDAVTVGRGNSAAHSRT